MLAALLVGCGPGLIPTRPDDPEVLPERFGLVAAQVVSNTERLAPMLKNWTAAFVVDIDDPEKRYRLDASATGLYSSRVFVGALPPGHYAIFNLHSFANAGDAQYWLNAPVPRSLGTFRIEESRLTSLGSLVYQPLGAAGKGRDKQRLYLITRLDEDEVLEDFVAEAYPEVYDEIRRDLVLGWEPSAFESGQQEEDLIERIRRFAVGMDAFRLADGTIVMTAPLGQILVREATGIWTNHATGQDRHLTHIVSTADGFLAGGERGLLMQSANLFGPWQRLPGPGARENVFWIHRDDRGRMFALTRAANRVRFYEVEDAGETWRVLREFEYQPGFFFVGGGHVHAVATSDGRIVLFADDQRLVYDANLDAFETSDDAGDMFVLAEQFNGVLVGRAGHWWTGVTAPRYSFDLGRTWTRLNDVRHVERILPATSSLPFVLSREEILAVSHRSYRDELTRRILPEPEPRVRLAHSDERIVWWGETMDEACTELLPGISTPELLFARCSDGRILVSDDLGRSWQVDHDPAMSTDDAPEELTGRQTT